MTTIEKLYYGHIRPHEKFVDPESRLAVLQDLLLSSDEDLMRLLPENCKGAYESFKAAYDEMNATLQVESFADGFSLGLRLGIESYGRKTACGRNGDKCRFSGQKKKRLKTKVPDREEIRLDCGRILCSHVKNAFICGLKLGARMAAEVLSDD